MNRFLVLAFCPVLLGLFLSVLLASCSTTKAESDRPNIIIIYADDMGFGDLNCQNPDSKIPTPNLDKMASEGIRFTDAHSSSGICSPSRFALLTGSYHWRRQHGIVGAFGKPFFDSSDYTLAHFLQDQQYQTACIGKWHLGWNWEFKNEPSLEVEQWGRIRNFYDVKDIDWTKPIQGGPLDRGFDYYYGDGTINFPPYAWVENDTFLELPSEIMDVKNIGFETKEGAWEFRPGPKVDDWNPYDVLPSLTKKAKQWIGMQSEEQAFFLYFALPSPHAPIIPNDEFDGKSKAGAYGDFMYQTDWVVGEILAELKKTGLEENTLLIFTSDNGPESYAWARARDYEHYSMGEFRGLKRDVWEGGHHVPFLVKWPKKIKAGQVSEHLVSQIDVFRTIASILETEVKEEHAIDSYDFSTLLLDKEGPQVHRNALVHNTYENLWGFREGEWLYINDSSGGSRKMPEFFMDLRAYKDFDEEDLLFNLREDPGQRKNLSEVEIDLKLSMARKLREIRESDRSAPD